MHELFRKFSQQVSALAGSVGAFALAFAVIIAWAVTGPAFNFSDTWQLVINTGTTIVTFLMVFLIQNTQNRESQAVHAKLDELILKLEAADNHLMDAEHLSDDELETLHERYKGLAKEDGKQVAPRQPRTKGRPDSEPKPEAVASCR